MRISIILPVYWPAIGGCEIHTRALVNGLAARHEVRVVAMLNSQKDKLAHPDLWRNCLLYAKRGGERGDVDGVRVDLVSLSPWERRLYYPFIRAYRRFEVLAMAVVERVFARHIAELTRDAELIHVVHGGVSFLGRAAQRVARARGIPFVFTSVLHELAGWDHLLHDQEGATDPWDVPFIKKAPATYHDRYWAELVGSADAVIALTDHERALLVRLEEVEARRIHVTGVGPVVDESGPTAEQMRSRHGLGDAKVALFLGRKHELKGIGEILQAAARVWEDFPEARFVFAGPTEGRAAELLAQHADPRILDIPPVTDAEKSGWLRACDLLVNPSVLESLGGVFLEAWNFERPIVGGDIPPVREISAQGEAGILVQRRDPQQIAAAILRLFSHPEEAQSLGRRGAERVRTRYSWQHLTTLTETAYAAATAG